MIWLKSFRVKRGFSQKELALAVDVQANTVWRWENKKASPSVEIIFKLCEVLNVTESELLHGPVDDGEIKFSFVLNISEVKGMDVKMNELKCGTGDNDIFGIFRFDKKNLNIEEIGAKFMNYLRAELAGDKVKRDELKKLEG